MSGDVVTKCFKGWAESDIVEDVASKIIVSEFDDNFTLSITLNMFVAFNDGCTGATHIQAYYSIFPSLCKDRRKNHEFLFTATFQFIVISSYHLLCIIRLFSSCRNHWRFQQLRNVDDKLVKSDPKLTYILFSLTSFHLFFIYKF